MPDDLRESSLAVACLILARRIDHQLPAREVAGVARELRLTLAELTAKVPAGQEGTKSDELRVRRARRIHASAKAAEDEVEPGG